VSTEIYLELLVNAMQTKKENAASVIQVDAQSHNRPPKTLCPWLVYSENRHLTLREDFLDF